MPAADDQRIAVEPLEKQLEVPEGCALQTLDALARHQGIAVDAHETLAELVFQGLERLVQQDLAVLMAQGHVLVVGDEVDHLVQRDQLDTLAGARTDMAARGAAAFRTRAGQGGQLRAVWTLGLAQGIAQVFACLLYTSPSPRDS